ncbi:lipopolysaccharide biosynthesis protein [Cytophaga aurantiaca]|uniref:lipopolysaccharide biosynthesis protein n=1 Tax=Cytophaga aurantiaca TaxID=29530 RepID=UPI000381A5DF|nr:oligosaccharide flippase family protein [Cytophaga aurantiaca]
MSLLKKLAGQTALYGLSSMIGRAINFLLVPVYTSLLLPAEYGIVTELYAYAAFFNILYLFGMETTYFRFANKKDADEAHIFNHVNTQVLFGSFIISAVIFLVTPSIAGHLSLGNAQKTAADFTAYIYYIVLILFTDAALAIAFARLRMRNKAFWFASVKLMNIGVTVLLNIILLWGIPLLLSSDSISEETKRFILSWYDPNDLVSYIFISNLVANLLQLPFLIKAFAGFKFVWDTYLYKPMLVYALPLMVMGLAGMINEMLDRLILRELLPDNFYPGSTKLHALGVYGACYKLSMFMTLAIQAFRYAAEPFFFSRAADKNSPQLFADIMKWFVLVCLLIFLGVSLNINIVKQFLGNKAFWEGLAIVPILLLANLFLGVYYNLAIWFKLTDKTYWGIYISLFGAALTVAGNIILIPLMGYMGAAYVTLLCYASMAIFSYLLGHKYYPIPYQTVKMGMWIISASFLVYLSSFVHFENAVNNLLISNSIIVVWLGIILLLEKRFNGLKA